MTIEQTKTFDEIGDIACPHCGEGQGIEPGENGQELVTYGGEEAVEFECVHCEKDFWIQEWVTRYWDSAKTYDEL